MTGYRTADGIFSVLRAGRDTGTPGGVARLKGYNPYLRLAYNRDWGSNSLMFGAFGMTIDRYLDNTNPDSGTDRFSDRGVDAQYQYVTNPHTFTAQARFIREQQHYHTSFAQGATSNPTDTLDPMQLKATYYYEHQHGVTISHFALKGTADPTLYPAGAVTGSANGSPDSRGFILELDYLPVQNVRLMLQYTSYDKFNGGSDSGYDGVTARSPHDNNTLFLNVWIAC